ncbi:MAG: hypothetical protein U9R74_00105 [Pseudomonadota bacterium]|nr:hypothetical protein [Pseudomonadota bacterium]
MKRLRTCWIARFGYLQDVLEQSLIVRTVHKAYRRYAVLGLDDPPYIASERPALRP